MPVLLYEKRNQIAYFTLNRPEALNAFNGELIEALGDALVDYRDDPSLLVAIMTGAGRAFSVGADLKEMTSEGRSAGTRPIPSLIRKEVWKPMIAAIDGYAFGAGGFGMSLQCDIRLATERSRLGDLAAPVGGVGALSLLNMIPMGEALRILLTGTHISAEEAYRIGLIQKVLPDREALIREAEAIAEEIKLCAPLSVQAVRRIAYTRFSSPPNEIQELEQSLRKQLSQTEDAKEGPRAFAEKRKPIWKMR